MNTLSLFGLVWKARARSMIKLVQLMDVLSSNINMSSSWSHQNLACSARLAPVHATKVVACWAQKNMQMKNIFVSIRLCLIYITYSMLHKRILVTCFCLLMQYHFSKGSKSPLHPLQKFILFLIFGFLKEGRWPDISSSLPPAWEEIANTLPPHIPFVSLRGMGAVKRAE